jgi:hypothetical protein
MNPSRFCLAALAVAGMALAAAAAPAPAPKSQGPISDFLLLRAALPPGEAPSVVEVSSDGDTFMVMHRMVVSVPVTWQEAVEFEGKSVVVPRTVMVPQVISRRSKVAVKDCKVFRVNKEGRLEAVEADKAAAQWKKPTQVLLGKSAEIDPRQLELVKPGTFYLVLSEAALNVPVEVVAPVPPPRGKPVPVPKD